MKSEDIPIGMKGFKEDLRQQIKDSNPELYEAMAMDNTLEAFLDDQEDIYLSRLADLLKRELNLIEAREYLYSDMMEQFPDKDD